MSSAAPSRTVSPRGTLAGAGLLLLLAAGVQSWVISTGRIPPNSDQAIVGLMAKHILEGEGHPVFYYGSTYAGSLEPHYVAGIFAVLGVSPGAYRFAMAILVFLTIGGVFLLTRRLFGDRAALVSVAYLAVPPFFFLYKGLTSDGAYVSFGLLTLGTVAAALAIVSGGSEGRRGALLWGALGLAVGLAWWVTPLTAIVSGATLVWLFLRRKGRPLASGVASLLAGFFAGSFPWWFWNLRHGWASLKAAELGTVAPGRAVSNFAGILKTTVPTLSGGMEATPNVLFTRPVFPFSREIALILFALLVAVSLAKALRGETARGLLLLVLGALLLVSAFSGRLVLSEPRYLFPYYVLVPPLAGAAVADASTRWKSAILAVVACAGALVLHVGSLGAAPVNRRLNDNEVTGSLDPLRHALEKAGIEFVYTDYWTAYRLSFESRERIIATPIPLDQHVRYAPYVERVGASPNPAVVLLPPRSGCFRSFLEQRGLAHRHSGVGPFGVFADLPAAALETIRSGRGLPLPSEAYRAAWALPPQPERLEAGSSRAVRAGVTNAGPCVWPTSVHLGYHWWPLEPGLPADYDSPRGFLPGVLYPGASASIPIELVAPSAPGRYRLEYDLVHENVEWFSTQGGTTASFEVRIGGEGAH